MAKKKTNKRKKKKTTTQPELNEGVAAAVSEETPKPKKARKKRARKKATKGTRKAKAATETAAKDTPEPAEILVPQAPEPVAIKTPEAKRRPAPKANAHPGMPVPVPVPVPVPAPVSETRPATGSVPMPVPIPVPEPETQNAPDGKLKAEADSPRPTDTDAKPELLVPESIKALLDEYDETIEDRTTDDDSTVTHVVEMSAEEAVEFLASLEKETDEAPETVASEDDIEDAELLTDEALAAALPVKKVGSVRARASSRRTATTSSGRHSSKRGKPETLASRRRSKRGRPPSVASRKGAERTPSGARRVVPMRPFRSALDNDWRVLTFESATVDAGMRVAGSTLARLYGCVRDESLPIDLGPICQTQEEFIAQWDKTPIGVKPVILANLSNASTFLATVAAERSDVNEAFWVVYETLRSDVTMAKNVFLAELRARNRARAIGFGPRNVIEAARRGAEAVRGHVEWGFGRKSHVA